MTRSASVFGFAVLLLLAVLGCVSSQPPDPECEGFPPVPADLEDALDSLMQWADPSVLAEYASSPEEEATGLAHFGIGLVIRNCLQLWGDSALSRYFNRIGIYHPDDMSGIILSSLWRQLNEVPIDLEGQVAEYQEYWEKLRD